MGLQHTQTILYNNMALKMGEKKWKFTGVRSECSTWGGIIVFQGDWGKVKNKPYSCL